MNIEHATAMLPASDLERAVRWYAEKLGLEPVRKDEYGAAYRIGGLDAFVYVTAFAGTAQSTALSIDSADLVRDMAELRARGVVFEEYDLPGLKTENGLVVFGTVKNAWAKDSEGNILGFVEGM